MTARPCPADVELVDRLVTDLARATGRPEQLVRHTYGIAPRTTDHAIELLRTLLAEMPTTHDPRGWLDARLHRLEHPEDARA